LEFPTDDDDDDDDDDDELKTVQSHDQTRTPNNHL